jgi:hypothetical protein
LASEDELGSREAKTDEKMPGKVWRTVWGTFGLAVTLLSGMFIAMSATELVTGEGDTERATLVGLIVVFGGLGFWGLNMARQGLGWRLPSLPRPHLKRKSRADKEQAVLAYAVSVGGRVTLVEAAGRCGLSLEEAESILNELAAREHAELLIAEDGTLVYDFDVLNRKEKERAKGIV